MLSFTFIYHIWKVAFVGGFCDVHALVGSSFYPDRHVCISTGYFSKTSNISVSFVFASNTMALTATEGLNADGRVNPAKEF